MIFHYVPLYSWESYISKINDGEVFFADSLSIQIAIFLIMRKWIKRNPGSYQLSKIIPNKDISIFITSEEYPNVDINMIVAPKNINNPEEYARSILNKINDFENLYIGISSPKQNLIAKEILKNNSKINVYAIGAIVDDFCLKRNKIPKIINLFYLEWLYRAIISPKRFCSKFIQIFVAVFALMVSIKKIKKFRILAYKIFHDQKYIT